MKFRLEKVTVREIADSYAENGDNVKGYAGWLNIRPKYQRGFVYDEAKRDAVIVSVMNGYPIGVMYWIIHKGVDYEVLDGQQRIMSICRYVNGKFPVCGKYFDDLSEDEKQAILRYKCMVYYCYDSRNEKSEWRETVNR